MVERVAEGDPDVVAVDPATGQLGVTRVRIVALTTTSISIALEAVGAVEGIVFDAQGRPVVGALVAGGVALGRTDANGFFRIEGVPAGTHIIEAGDPVTKRRGAVSVTVLPGQTARAVPRLEARATIEGRVLDATGTPVPKATVRIPQGDGYIFVVANNAGFFRFPDMVLDDYLIQAPGPPWEALCDSLKQRGMSCAAAFTMGDVPAEAGPDPAPDPHDVDAVLAAYERALRTFFSIVDPRFSGIPPPPDGGFGWNKVRLLQDSITVTANIRYLPQSTVSGTTVDGNGLPTGALVRVSALQVAAAGGPTFKELRRLTTDAASGQFAFDGIPVFDLATFQATAIQAGDFTLEATTPFSPTIVQYRGRLTVNNPRQDGILLQFPPAGATNGTISGTVVMPDGVTRAPEGTVVRISFGDLTVTTDAEGRFRSLLPIPAAPPNNIYTVTAEEPISGFSGQIGALVPAGGNVDVRIRLLGLGAVTVTVKRPNGLPVPGALVSLQGGTFRRDHANGPADATGVIRFTNITEGPFGVMATEVGTGLGGRASGAVPRDGEVSVTLVITASGRVTGSFLTVDGRTPVPNAQILLKSGPVEAYATTSGEGRFELRAIPVGPFTVSGTEPLTGRAGRTGGELRFEGDAVDITLIQGPQGTVQGFVLNADGVTPVPGALIEISSPGLQATTRPDGSFRFEGIPAGGFSLHARETVSGFEGSATGTIVLEGEVVSQNVLLDPAGTLRVTVLDHEGSPVGNAEVVVTGPRLPGGGRLGAVDVTGQVTFDLLHLGTYQIVARSLADAHDGGQAAATLGQSNEIRDVTVQLGGLGRVEVTVVEGGAPVPSARVTLKSTGAGSGEPPGPFGDSYVAFTDAAGRATIGGIAPGDFFVTAELGPLAGVSTGTVPAPGDTVETTVVLEPSGTIKGRVILPDGMTAAPRAFVTLSFQSRSELQSGLLQVTTGPLGTFEFVGIPLGPFSISVFERITSGVRARDGSLDTDGQVVDVGDLVLDNSAPRVVSVQPPDRATNAPLSGPITLTFSEPMVPSTLRAPGGVPVDLANLLVLQGSTAIAGTLSVATDRRSVTFTPSVPLESGGLYVVTLKAAPDGPTDDVGFQLVDPFVSTFTTRDAVAPTVVSSSPGSGERQVPPDAVVRVTFSEAVAAGLGLTLADGQGRPVAGRVDLAIANTVAIFTPTDFLQPNTSYTATLTGVTDVAGNPLAGGSVSIAFATVDTRAPVLNALHLQGTPTPFAGTAVVVEPDLTGDGVARIEYQVNGQAPQVVTAAPFALVLTLPTDATSVQVTGIAVDEFGNRSMARGLTVPVTPNGPPTVTFTTPTVAPTLRQGESAIFQVAATDDVALSQVVFSTAGATTQAVVRNVPAGQTAFTTSFSFVVPGTAVSNSDVTVQAAAIDTAGGRSTPATMALRIGDGIRPTVAVTSPVANAVVLPGQAFDVVVTASDDVGIASVTLGCTPALVGCGTRAVAGNGQTAQSFTVETPIGITSSTVALTLIATDVAGNSSLGASRLVQVADTVPPAIAALRQRGGSTRIVPGQAVVVEAEATDNRAVTAVTFSTEGALVTPATTVGASPPASSAVVPFALTVPAEVAFGTSVTVRANARDAQGNTSAGATLTLSVEDTAPPVVTVLAPAEGAQVQPGQNVTLTVDATDDVAVRQVAYSASGVITGGETRTLAPPATPASVTFTVPVPPTAPPGSLTLAVTAVDAAGKESIPALRHVVVLDTVPPTVRIASPQADAVIDPGTPLSVTVEASDAGGVTEVGFVAAGVTSVSTSRAIAPPATTTTQIFEIPFAAAPPAGGILVLSATARDAAGHQGTAAPVVVTVRDVVAPRVLTVSPADGATDVDLQIVPTVQFSEPVRAETVTAATVSLMAGQTEVPVSVSLSGGASVTLTPLAQPLSPNTTFTIRITTGVTDIAGNALAAPVTTTFRTRSADVTSPHVATVVPALGATGVSVAASIMVTFDEPIAPATVTATSFRVLADGVAVPGTLSFEDGDATVRFRPAAPLPLSTIVTLQLGTGITDATGNPLAGAREFTFTTGGFSITSPTPGGKVPELQPDHARDSWRCRARDRLGALQRERRTAPRRQRADLRHVVHDAGGRRHPDADD